MKNIFTKTLTLIAFLSLSAGVWGEDKSLPNDGTLSFAWSSRSGNQLLGSWTWSNNCISDGLWEWSGEGENHIKMSQSIYCTFKVPGTYNAQTRDRYEFDAGTYTFTFYYYFDEPGCQYYEPEVRLSADQDRNTVFVSPKGSYVDGHSTGAYTKVVEVEVLSKGYYYIRLITGLNNNKPERFGYEKVVIAKAGPTAMKRIYMPKTTFDNWTTAGAKFAVYRITDSKWQDHYMTSGTGCLVDYYYDDIPETCEKVIIGRFNPSSNPPFGWGDSDNKPWNQTVDVTLGSNNCVAPKNDKDGNNYKCDLSTFTPPTYAVTYAAGDHGTGEMTDNNSPYACGSDVTVLENEFEAVRGYVFNNFSDGSKTYDAGDVIEDLQAAKTLTAQWTALKSYTITASADPSHKGHVDGAGTYYEGETITLTAVSEDANKYMFTSWSDGNTSNPRVFTAQNGITTNYVANFISGKKECGNTLTIQCETDYVLPEGKSINSSWFFVPKNGGEHSEYTGSHPTDTKGYVDFKGQGGTMYYPMQIGETATISYDVWICNTDNPKLYVYSSVATSGSSNITYGGKTYYQIENHEIPQVGKPFGHQVIAGSNTLQPGDYIIALGANGWTVIDQIVLTSSPAAFCTITPAAKCTISYAMNGHGTQIGDVLIEEGETWTAPTPDPTEYGWKFDGWKRPSSTEDETLYKSGSTGFTVSGNETLTAQWSEDLSTAYFMKGTFVDDYKTQYDFVKKTGESTGNIAYLTIDNLSAGTDYWFMVYKSPIGSWGQTSKDGKMTADNNTWTLNGGNNVGMTTTAKGSYTFQIDFKNADPQIHIEYPAAYTITFDKGNNSATGTMNNMVNIAENEEVTLTTNSYALGCNHFVKWKDQDNNEYEDGAQVTVTKNLNLTAQWAINRYKAIYDANGVTGYTGDLPATVEYDCGAQVTISQTPKLSKFGYTFIGWNTDPNATVALADNYQFTIDQGDTKIYAIWNVKKPTGLSIAPETGTYQVTKGTGVQMRVTLTPDASELAEENREVTWSTSNSTFATVNQSGYVNFVGQGSVTITATSKLDGSVSNSYNFEVGAGSCVGWEISAFDDEGKNPTMDYFYQVGSTDEWRVKYVLPNGTRKFWVGNCSGWVSDRSSNWDFGWIRLKDRRDNKCGNNTQYAGQDAVGELVIWSSSTDKDQNFGIAFLPNYKISYMTDGSNWRIMDFHSTSTQYAYETDIFQVPEGYKTDGNMKYFVGVEKNTGENMMVEEISQQDAMNGVNGLKDADMAGKYGKWHISSNSCDRNWYCQFTRYYQVRFEMNGGDGNIDPMYFVGDNSQSFNTNTLTNPTRTGYELTGWKDQEDHTYTTSQSITVTKDLVLTAQWTAKDYAITLDKNNGSTNGSASAKYDSNTLNSISHVGNRTGYSLAGYFTLAENGSQVITAEGALVASAPDYTDENRNWKKASNCTLYAQWTANKYNVNFDFDGGAGGKSSIEVTYDAAMPSAAPLPTREFYDFAGYYTEKNGQGTQYYTANGISAHVWDITTNNTTLYAYWTPKSYAITWNFDGGQATSEDYTKGDVPYGTTIKAPTVEKTGYNFAGWNPAVGTMPGAPTTYTAQWTAKQYTITLDKNADDGNNGSVTVTYNSGETTDFSAPTRDNYVIEGFYAENTYTTKVLNADGTLCTSVENYTDASGNWVNTTCTTLYTKWTVDYCSNTLRIDCPVDWVKHVDCRANNESKFGTFYSSTGGGWITHHDGDGVGDMYFAYNTSAESEITFNIHVGGLWNDGQAVAYFYNEDENGSLIINDVKYSQDGSSQNIWRGSQHETLENITIVRTISAGKHILHFHASNYANFDVVDLTASSSVFCPEMYEVNFAANPSDKGTVTAQINGDAITSGTEVPENTVVVFTASNIASGYELVNWTDGSGNVLAGAVPSFEQKITSNITVNANIEVEATKYAVTVTPGGHGSITSGAGEYREGAPVTIVTAPDANYKVGSATASNVDNFTIDGNNVSFTMPNEAVEVTIYFVFDAVHNMIATGTSANINNTRLGGNGSITKSAVENGAFDHTVLQYDYNISNGDYCGYSLPKDAGYTPNPKATGFAFWFMTNDKVYMEIKADGDSKVFKLPNTNGEWHYIYLADEAAKTATSFEVWMNYSKDSWSMSNPQGTMYITEIQATNVTSQDPIVPPVNLTVTKNPDDGGTVTTDPGTTTGLTKGTEVTLTANPADNYRFVNWTVGGEEVSTDATYNRIVNATETITANFVRVYTLVVNYDEHIASVTGAGQYAENESVTVTATAAQGYKFTKWTKDNASGEDLVTTSSYTFDMPATDNYTVYANSEQDIVTYHITLGTCTNGSIVATVNDESYDGGELEANTPVVLTPTPNEGYGFVQWQDGNTDNPRTIIANAETQAITWTATFAVRHTVTATFGKPGDHVTGGGEYATGAEVTLEAFVSETEYDYDYQFSQWKVISGSAPITGHEKENPLRFTMPSNDVSIKALFAPVECVDNFVIQCEDDQAYIPWNRQGADKDLTKYPNSIPHDGQCGPYHDYYNGYHSTGYYDYKSARSAEMYYPIELPASTYKFEIWSASNGDKNCWMNLYIESDDASYEVVYKGVKYKKASFVTANNNCGEGGDFAISGTIENVVINSPKSVIIGLYCGEDYGAFDQIVITATNPVFCHELSTDTCIIKAEDGPKEIPVCGVNYLIMHDGAQANNVEDVEIFKGATHVRNAVLNIWDDFTVPFTCTEIKVWDAEDKQEYKIKPVQYISEDTNNPGHFYMQTLEHEEMATVIGKEFSQRWRNTTQTEPQANVPYIIEFVTEQNNGYFANRPIYYRRDQSCTVHGFNNASVDNGSWPQDGTKPTFHYVANDAVVPVYPYDAYVLSEDHTMFELKEQPTIMPFHCYIQASAETKAKAPRLMLSGGGGTPTTLVPIYTDAEHQNYKVMIDEIIYVVREGKIYTVMGQLVK